MSGQLGSLGWQNRPGSSEQVNRPGTFANSSQVIFAGEEIDISENALRHGSRPGTQQTGRTAWSTGADGPDTGERPGTQQTDSGGRAAWSTVADRPVTRERPPSRGPPELPPDLPHRPVESDNYYKLPLQLSRIKQLNVDFSMGTVIRNALTGEISTQKSIPWYTIVDLKTRSDSVRQAREWKKDPYLFKVVPLHYRTWIWHYYYKQKSFDRLMRKDITGNPLNQSINLVLNERCVDVYPGIGLYSPLMSFCILGLFSVLTVNRWLPYLCVVANFFLLITSMVLNTPSAYWYSRFATLPFRLAIFVAIITSALTSTSAFGWLGYSGCIVAFLIDILAGDLKQFLYVRYLCRYVVIRELPGNLFLCRRVGAAHLEETHGPRGQISHDISGFAMWKRSFTLIANLHGLLVELRPMSEADWDRCLEAQQSSMDSTEPGSLYFYPLDVFSDSRPSYESLGLNIQEESAKIRKAPKKEGLSQKIYEILSGDVDDDLSDAEGKVDDEPLDPPPWKQRER